MIDMPTTPVYLTEHEQECFLLFQKYRDVIELLEESNFLRMKNGSITLKLNKKGQLKVIEKKEMYEKM